MLTKEHLDKNLFLFLIHNNNINIFVLLFDNDLIKTAVLKLCKKRQAMILKDWLHKNEYQGHQFK